MAHSKLTRGHDEAPSDNVEQWEAGTCHDVTIDHIHMDHWMAATWCDVADGVSRMTSRHMTHDSDVEC